MSGENSHQVMGNENNSNQYQLDIDAKQKIFINQKNSCQYEKNITKQNDQFYKPESKQQTKNQRIERSQPLGNTSTCLHKKLVQKQSRFCRDCGIFVPNSGAAAFIDCQHNYYPTVHPNTVYNIMLKNKDINRVFIQNADFQKCRLEIVDWISDIGDAVGLQRETIHLAYSYLDVLLSKWEVPIDRYQLVGASCILVAYKFMEKESQIVIIEKLMIHCKDSLNYDSLISGEMELIKALNFKLRSETPSQFIEYYLQRGVVFSTDQSSIRPIDQKLLRYLRKYAEFLVDLSLQNYQFNKYSADVLASSIISYARQCVGIQTKWCPELKELTYLSWDEIEVCTNEFCFFFQINFPDIAKKVNKQNISDQKRKQIKEQQEHHGHRVQYKKCNQQSMSFQPSFQDAKEVDFHNEQEKDALVNQQSDGERKNYFSNLFQINQNENQPMQKCMDSTKMSIERQTPQTVQQFDEEKFKTDSNPKKKNSKKKQENSTNDNTSSSLKQEKLNSFTKCKISSFNLHSKSCLNIKLFAENSNEINTSSKDYNKEAQLQDKIQEEYEENSKYASFNSYINLSNEQNTLRLGGNQQ